MKQNARTAKLFSGIVIGVLLIHAASAVPFYLVISGELGTDPPHGVPYAYIALRLLRFALCLAFSLLARRKLIGAGGVEIKTACLSILLVLLFVTLLYMSGWGEKFYLAVSYRAGIYGPENAPLFLAVLWEQVFSVDLLYSALIGALAAAVPVRPRRRA